MKDVKMNLTFDNVRFAELIDTRYKEDSTKYPYCTNLFIPNLDVLGKHCIIGKQEFVRHH